MTNINTNIKYLFLLFICFTYSLNGMNGMNGILKGTIVDESTGEPISFATIYIPDLEIGTMTELDGQFELEVPEGIYMIQFSFLGYSDLIVNNAHIIANEVNEFKVTMKEEETLLDEIIVRAKQLKYTDASIATLKRKSINVVDGIASQSFSRIGDGNVGDAIKRVSGVSVQDGKNVFVRGLGDRYSRTLLNGLNLPGLDPDKNSVQMDIFPTNIIENILVYKTFSPNLPGDFSGGIVDVITKFHPEKKTFKISASTTFNLNSNLNSNYLSYEGGHMDMMGMDDGTRALPFHPNSYIPDVTSGDPQLLNLTSGFSKTMAAKKIKSGINQSYGFTYGDNIALSKGNLAYVIALNYKSKHDHIADQKYATYIVDNNNIRQDKETEGAISTSKILWGGIFGSSYKVKNHEFLLNYFGIQNGEDKAAQLISKDYDDNPSTIYKDVLHYSQRKVHNIKIGSNHHWKDNKIKLHINFSPTWVEVDEPDLRSTGFELDESGEYVIRPSIGADVTRTFRNLSETSYNGKIDLAYSFKQWNTLDASFQVGINYLNKERDYQILNYLFRVKNQNSLDLQGNPDNIFKAENLWHPDQGTNGTFVIGNFEPANSFNARQNIGAAYGMITLPFTTNLKSIIGARIEKTDNYYTGTNNLGTIKLADEKVLDELDILPSLNFVYTPFAKSNIRLSYTKTVARPSFKEKSIAQIQDRISGRTFIGNLDLIESHIDNIDLRLEKYFTGSSLASLSFFYKNLNDPIELESYDDLSPDNYTPRNQSNAQLFGTELEFKSSLSFIHSSLSGLNLQTNLTLVKSQVKRTINVTTHDNKYRTLVGQAPYLLNASLSYENRAKNFSLNTSYNVQGKMLHLIGSGRIPDVYENPFHSITIQSNYIFGVEKKYKISAGIKNLLDTKKQYIYDNGDITTDSESIFSEYSIGRSYSLGISVRLY